MGCAEASTANHDVVARDGAAQPPDGEKRIVAIFRRDVARAAALAGSFKEAGIEAMTLVTAEALRGLLGGTELHLLVLDNELDGFFSGLEVIKKLRTSLVRVPAILLHRHEESGPIDAKSAGAVTVVDANSDEATIVKLSLTILDRQSEEGNGIPERPAIVERQSDLPVLSQLTMQLLQYLEMPPEQVPVNDLCRMISIDPRATAILFKASNASMNGVSRSISNVADAVRVLGVRPTIGHVLNAAVTSGLGSCPKDCRASSGLARPPRHVHRLHDGDLRPGTGKPVGRAAFLLGILQDVGILGLLRGFPKQYQAVLRRWENDRSAAGSPHSSKPTSAARTRTCPRR